MKKKGIVPHHGIDTQARCGYSLTKEGFSNTNYILYQFV